MLENCKLRFHYLVTTDEVIDSAVAQLNDNKIVAWMQGRMEFGSRALGNRSILASPAQPLFHREPEHLHQAPRAVPQVRRLGARGTGCRVFRSRPQRALPRHRGPRQARSIANPSPPPLWPATWSASTPSIATRIRSTGSCCTPPARPPACRCSTTRPSISSASRWSARRATPSAASTPPESTPCSSATSSCRSSTAGSGWDRVWTCPGI